MGHLRGERRGGLASPAPGEWRRLERANRTPKKEFYEVTGSLLIVERNRELQAWNGPTTPSA